MCVRVESPFLADWERRVARVLARTSKPFFRQERKTLRPAGLHSRTSEARTSWRGNGALHRREHALVHVRDPDFTHRVTTANGIARVAIVTLDSVAIEDIMVRNVRAAVAEPGKLTKTLLGMSFLGQLRRTEMSRGVLVLEE